jgi:hypothetical protein
MKEYNPDFELDLNHIMTGELLLNKGSLLEDKKLYAIQTLLKKRKKTYFPKK